MTPAKALRGLIVAAAASHSGKTTVTLGLIAALRKRGLTVAAAKCGPDYIDPRFLEAASGGPVVNLDPWAMAPAILRERLARLGKGADLVVVEGVMGLYDGGPGAAGSTASLSTLTDLPVVLVVGAEGQAQTAAAVAEGCARLAQDFKVIGAVVNQVASERHAALIREGFARTSLPLLGMVRRDAGVALPSRHLGLVQAEEHDDLQRKIARVGELVAEGCDLDELLAVSAPLPPCGGEMERGDSDTYRTWPSSLPDPPPQGGRGLTPLGQRIAVARDVAFAFAYPHLLMDWREAGADISFFSPLSDEAPAADADAVYLPGGYPELHANTIAAARSFRLGMLAAAERGALVYGECGGYMVLGESLIDAEGVDHPMLGLLPLVTSFKHRMLHLGYRLLRPIGELPWDVPLTAHEFHFARVVSEGDGDPLFEAEGADGTVLGPMGLRRERVMGSFAHVIDAR
jgi:cobyrinic acid a,c-diamide synthase